MSATDEITALMAAVKSVLEADAALTALMGGTAKVYDRSAEPDIAPYVTIGEATRSVDWSSDTHRGEEVAIDVHCWDEPTSGTAETRKCRDMMARVRAVLNFTTLSLAAPYAAVVVHVVGRVGPLVDTDAKSLHGVVRVRALVQAS